MNLRKLINENIKSSVIKNIYEIEILEDVILKLKIRIKNEENRKPKIFLYRIISLKDSINKLEEVIKNLRENIHPLVAATIPKKLKNKQR